MSISIQLLNHIKSNIKKYAEEVSETKNKNRSKRIGSKSLLNHLKNNFKIPSKRSDLKALFAIIELNLDENDNIEDIREILILLNTILPKLIKKTSTLNHEYTLYRNLIKRAFGERSKIYLDSKTLIKITEQQIKELLQLQQDRVERNNANLIEFDFKDVRNVALEASKNKNNVLDQIIAFQLATGCRLVECLKISEFKAGSIQEANGKIIRYVTQIGVAKDKNADLYNKSTKRVVKPILFFNFEDLEKMLNIIRKDAKSRGLSNASNQVITNSYNSTLNSQIATYLSKAKSHSLRKIYANISYEIYADKAKVSLQAWIKRVLGHDFLGLTSLSYSTVSITNLFENLAIQEMPKPEKRYGQTLQCAKKYYEDLKKNGIKNPTKKMIRRHYSSRVTTKLFKELEA
jgi:integrase